MNAAAAPETSALLYLDGVTVSFDGFKALTRSPSWWSRARCAR